MTDATTRSRLEQAYSLIQQEQEEKAMGILKPIVAAQPNNIDAWWLMANAAGEPEDAAEALSNVLRLDPNHAQARELYDGLVSQYPELAHQSYSSGASDFSSDFGSDFTPGEDVSIDALFGDSPSSGGFPEDDKTAAYDVGSFFSSSDDSLETTYSSDISQKESSDLDAFFSGKKDDQFSDSFGGSDPGFIGDVEGKPSKKDQKKAEKAAKDAERAEKKAAAEAAKAEKAAAAPKKPGKPTKLAPEAAPPDPFEKERRANRQTSPLLPLLLILLIVGAGAFGVYYLLNRPPVPPGGENVARAIEGVESKLALTQFQNPDATFTDGAFTVQACGAPGRTIQQQVNGALDLIAPEVAIARDAVKTVTFTVTRCNDASRIVYRGTAPIDAIVAYMSGGLADKTTFRSSWK